MYVNYDQLLKENEGRETCINCVHGAVCGMYALLFGATEDMREYEELTLRFEEVLYNALALNCHRYEEYKN
ncbi:MAG: hypothetical protein WC503_01170 [Candidatus Shapirobacteria bacterium]